MWLVLSIGCIECGEDNNEPLEGVFGTREEALACIADLRAEQMKHAEGWPNMAPRDHASGGFSTSDWQVRLVEATSSEEAA